MSAPAPRPKGLFSNGPLLSLLALLALAGGMRLVRLSLPPVPVLDEVYYVNAARLVLGQPRPPDDPWAFHPPGLDPNQEHPPLGKLLLAGSIGLLGDTPLGWRLTSVVWGLLAVLLVWALVRRLGGSAPAALLAGLVMAFENLSSLHSRLALLDAPLVALMLAALYAWACERPVLAGLGLVAASLCKITGLYGLAVIALLDGLKLWKRGRWDWPALRPFAACLATVAVGLPLILGVLDAFWSGFKDPFRHLHYMLTYASTLTDRGTSLARTSAPWQWLLNQVPMTYYDDPKLVITARMNPVVIFAALPVVAVAAWRGLRLKDERAFWVLALFFGTLVPVWLSVGWSGRLSYIYYFLPTIPALAVGLGFLFESERRWVAGLRWAYAAAAVVGFFLA